MKKTQAQLAQLYEIAILDWNVRNSFRDQHEVLRWLHIQLGTLLVADHHCFFAAAFAHALIRRARQHPAVRAENSKISHGPARVR
jgi:hypothetical protein